VTNDERLHHALMGFLLGGMIGMISVPIFILVDVDLMWWFLFAIFVCGTLGATLGWCNAERLEEWGRRKQ